MKSLLEKIQSELHGDMQRVAEMSTPPRLGRVPQRLKPSSEVSPNGTIEIVPYPKSHHVKLIREVVTELSEIPCRVSSDLHEWRNESATVLPTGTANL